MKCKEKRSQLAALAGARIHVEKSKVAQAVLYVRNWTKRTIKSMTRLYAFYFSEIFSSQKPYFEVLMIRTRLMYHAACKVEFQPFAVVLTADVFQLFTKKKMTHYTKHMHA